MPYYIDREVLKQSVIQGVIFFLAILSITSVFHKDLEKLLWPEPKPQPLTTARQQDERAVAAVRERVQPGYNEHTPEPAKLVAAPLRVTTMSADDAGRAVRVVSVRVYQKDAAQMNVVAADEKYLVVMNTANGEADTVRLSHTAIRPGENP